MEGWRDVSTECNFYCLKLVYTDSLFYSATISKQTPILHQLMLWYWSFIVFIEWVNGLDQQVSINVIEGPDRESMVPIGLSSKADGSDGSAQIEVSNCLQFFICIAHHTNQDVV